MEHSDYIWDFLIAAAPRYPLHAVSIMQSDNTHKATNMQSTGCA